MSKELKLHNWDEETIYIDFLKEPEAYDNPRWEIFMGNNHNSFKNHTKRMPLRSFRASEFISKPLSKSLWETLTQVLCIENLRIFKHDWAHWLDGHGCGYCEIILSDNDNVDDIIFHPYTPPTSKEVAESIKQLDHSNITPLSIVESVGCGIINDFAIDKISLD